MPELYNTTPIVLAAGKEFNIDKASILCKTIGSARASEARDAAIYVAHTNNFGSLAALAKAFSRDQSSIHLAIKRAKERMRIDRTYAATLKRLLKASPKGKPESFLTPRNRVWLKITMTGKQELLLIDILKQAKVNALRQKDLNMILDIMAAFARCSDSNSEWLDAIKG